MFCKPFVTISGPTRSILIYSDRPTGAKIINGVEQPSMVSKKVKTTEHSLPTSETVHISNKSAYHSYYVFPRSSGNTDNSPNLVWHELNLKNTRGRSVSPPDLESRVKVTRESSMPASSLLVKSMTISEPEKIKPNYTIKSPRLSRENVDRALDTLRKRTPSPNLRRRTPSPKPVPKVFSSERLAKLSANQSFKTDGKADLQTEIKVKVEENDKNFKPKIQEKIRVEFKEVEKSSPKIPSRPLNVSLSNGSGQEKDKNFKSKIQEQIDLNREKIRVEIKEVEKASPKIPSRPLNVTNLKKNPSLSNGSGPPSKKVETKKEVQSLPAVYQEMQELLKDAVDKSMESANVTKFSSDVKGETPQFQYNVVVAIDFGTTFSGYAYSFTHDPENIHIMRKWEGNHATSRNNLLL